MVGDEHFSGVSENVPPALYPAIAQRTREIGIRMALGARRRDVLGMVVVRGALLTVAGLAAGIVIALAVTRLLATLLFGVAPTDLETFTCVSAALLAARLAASYLPARRATRVDPLVALRYE